MPAPLESIGRSIIAIGVILVVLGGLILLAGRLHLPFPGRLPGDFLWRRDGVTIYFPVVSCLLASIVLTVVVNLIVWLLRR